MFHYRLAKTIPIILGATALSLSLILTVLTVSQTKQAYFQTATKASEQIVELSFSPKTGSWKVGKTQVVGLIVSSSEKIVSGVDIAINFDPGLVKVNLDNLILKKDLLEKILVKKIDNGKIIFSLSTRVPKKINSIIGSIVFTPIKSGQLNLSFSSSTDVIEARTIRNILNKKGNATYNISN